jgi:hypothetical protein
LIETEAIEGDCNKTTRTMRVTKLRLRKTSNAPELVKRIDLLLSRVWVGGECFLSCGLRTTEDWLDNSLNSLLGRSEVGDLEDYRGIRI